MHSVTLFVSLLLFSSTFAVIELKQSDFDNGTYLLTEPGEYILIEDIVFNPNSVSALGVSPYESGDVLPSQMGKYPPSAFGLGFFAAIAFSADGAVLDLNGHTIQQHPEHALQQRFYANIELADRPFIPNQGPHNFGNTINSARNSIIKNGRLGLSCHHGIHGNGPMNVTIENLDIVNYEVAAIAINGGKNNRIINVRSLGSREDIPVVGTFSAGRFLRPYVNYLRDNEYDGTLTVDGKELTINDIYNDLKESLNNVYEDVITKAAETNGRIDQNAHPDEYALYHNRFGIIDGNAYGLLLNKLGVAINGFPTVPEENVAENGMYIKNLEVINHVGAINEIVSLRAGIAGDTSKSPVVLDSVGSVFQVFNKHPETREYITISDSNLNNARFVGNVIANTQAFIGKAIANNAFASSRLDTSRSNFTPALLAWIEADSSAPEAVLSNYIEQGFPLVCNVDSMNHANKGIIGLKIDAAIHVQIDGVRLYNITNFGDLGADICGYGPDDFTNDVSTLPGYQGANSRGFSFSGSVDVMVENVEIEHVDSHCGSATGFDILLDSHDITISGTSVDNIKSSVIQVREDYVGPNAIPTAIGYRAAATASNIYFEEYKENGRLTNNAGGMVQLVLNEASGFSSFYSENSSSSSSSYSFSSSTASSIYFSSFLFVLSFWLL